MFAVGLVAGGVATAIALWFLGHAVSQVPVDWRAGAVFAAALIALARDLGVVKIRLPENRRQIPREVFDRGISAAALQFGFELGTGVRTYLSASSPYVLAVAVVFLCNSLALAAVVGVGFGAGRVLMPIQRACSKEADAWDLLMTSRRRVLVPFSACAAVLAVAALTAG